MVHLHLNKQNLNQFLRSDPSLGVTCSCKRFGESQFLQTIEGTADNGSFASFTHVSRCFGSLFIFSR